MISALRIRNRQSHEATDLDFHPGLNLIVGRGDSGKSAIFRSLLWPINNTSGESQISFWAKSKSKSGKLVLKGESSVTVESPNGALSRTRNPDFNGYIVNGNKYEALRTDIPKAVSDFFGFSDVNVATQHAPAFLIALPGPQVSTYLNNVVGMEAIDAYLKASSSLITEGKKDLKRLQGEQDTDEARLSRLSWVDGLQEQLESVESDAQSRDAYAAKAGTLRTQIAIHGNYTRNITALEPLASLDTSEVRRLHNAANAVSAKASGLSRLLGALRKATEAEREAGKLVALSGAVEAVRGLETERRGILGKREGLQKSILAYGLHEATARRLPNLENLVGWVAKLKEASSTAYEVSDSALGLSRLMSYIQSANEALGRLEGLESVETLAARVRKIKSRADEVARKSKDISENLLTWKRLERTIKIKEAEVSELEAQRPEVCPTCGGQMHKGGH